MSLISGPISSPYSLKDKGLKVSFLPFRQGGLDPFEQFILSINLPTTLPWKSCPQRHYNCSPKTEGLARWALSQHLKESNIPPKAIGNSSQLILNEEQRRRWNDPSFWGYSRKLSKKVAQHFKANNNKFAKAAWGCDWEEAFSTTNQTAQRRRSTYTPGSIENELRMHGIAHNLLSQIQGRIERKNTPINSRQHKKPSSTPNEIELEQLEPGQLN